MSSDNIIQIGSVSSKDSQDLGPAKEALGRARAIVDLLQGGRGARSH